MTSDDRLALSMPKVLARRALLHACIVGPSACALPFADKPCPSEKTVDVNAGVN
jgi:hypothetical protein